MVKASLVLILILFQGFTNAQEKTESGKYISPFASYSEAWNDPKYAMANTAATADYMSDSEKQVIYLLNLVRMNPKLFCETVLKEHPVSSGYYNSLVNTLNAQEPLSILYPDSLCFISAQCHAVQSGQTGYTGHDRTRECERLQHFMGECCQYGYEDALNILLDLLIDEDVPSLGHRNICLGERYKQLGVAIRPHTTYRYNTVMDFY
jgi:uncharacterized protein YkwD